MIKPTNKRILVSLTAEDYKKFVSEPNIPLFRGVVHSVSEGSFSENPVATDGQGSFSWVRRPSDSNLSRGDSILFIRDGMCVPAMISDGNPVSETTNSWELPSNLLYLVLIEENSIFAVVDKDSSN